MKTFVCFKCFMVLCTSKQEFNSSNYEINERLCTVSAAVWRTNVSAGKIKVKLTLRFEELSLFCFFCGGVLCRRFFRWKPRWEGSSWTSQRLWTLKTAHTIWDCQSTTCHTHTGRASSSQSIRWEGYLSLTRHQDTICSQWSSVTQQIKHVWKFPPKVCESC